MILFLFNILRINRQNETKFCIHIFIDKIYIEIVTDHFSQICKGVTALDLHQNLVFTQYLENEWTEITKFCIHIIIDKIPTQWSTFYTPHTSKSAGYYVIPSVQKLAFKCPYVRPSVCTSVSASFSLSAGCIFNQALV